MFDGVLSFVDFFEMDSEDVRSTQMPHYKHTAHFVKEFITQYAVMKRNDLGLNTALKRMRVFLYPCNFVALFSLVGEFIL